MTSNGQGGIEARNEGREEVEECERTYLSHLYLWVDVQDADLSCFHHLVYRVDLSAIQVPIILAMLQETAIFDVTLHFAAGHEGVHLAISLIHLWFSGGD